MHFPISALSQNSSHKKLIIRLKIKQPKCHQKAIQKIEHKCMEKSKSFSKLKMNVIQNFKPYAQKSTLKLHKRDVKSNQNFKYDSLDI